MSMSSGQLQKESHHSNALHTCVAGSPPLNLEAGKSPGRVSPLIQDSNNKPRPTVRSQPPLASHPSLLQSLSSPFSIMIPSPSSTATLTTLSPVAPQAAAPKSSASRKIQPPASSSQSMHTFSLSSTRIRILTKAQGRRPRGQGREPHHHHLRAASRQEERENRRKNNLLTVSGESKLESDRDEHGYVVRERRLGPFWRSFPVPEGVEVSVVPRVEHAYKQWLTCRRSSAAGYEGSDEKWGAHRDVPAPDWGTGPEVRHYILKGRLSGCVVPSHAVQDNHVVANEMLFVTTEEALKHNHTSKLQRALWVVCRNFRLDCKAALCYVRSGCGT